MPPKSNKIFLINMSPPPFITKILLFLYNIYFKIYKYCQLFMIWYHIEFGDCSGDFTTGNSHTYDDIFLVRILNIITRYKQFNYHYLYILTKAFLNKHKSTTIYEIQKNNTSYYLRIDEDDHEFGEIYVSKTLNPFEPRFILRLL